MSFDPAACRRELAQNLDGSEELDALVSQIGVFDTQSIVTFGSGAAEQAGQCADRILHSELGRVSDSGPLLTALGRVMEQFDPEEAAGGKKTSGWHPFSGKRKQDPNQLLDKYRAMGGDVDKVYIELKKYEAEIQRFQGKLQELLDANVRSYQLLVRYILAGEEGLRQMESYLTGLRADLTRRPGDRALQSDCEAVQRASGLLERRLHDLHVVEIVALQAIPMLQTMQYNNECLMEKIRSAFLVTLPVFKQALAQAVRRKRQSLQDQAMRALEERTREQSRAQSAGETGQEESLKETWRTIVNGIEETRRIQSDTETRRAADAVQLGRLVQSLPGV
ncbi:MAG: toxic anion resistance protein [Oscillospiraceae bacterium]|nr:toxic anion resistance protein [Oscillospiraceae bacterium]